MEKTPDKIPQAYTIGMDRKIIPVILLLLAVFLIPFFSARNFSPSNDEMSHISSGYSYWKLGEFTFNTQHPPLVKLLSSIPVMFMNIHFKKLDPAAAASIKWDEWQFGKELLFNNDADKILLWARLTPILLSVLLGFYLFRWASELFSYKAGILSLFLYALMPNIIAHAQFVTMDVAVAALSFITLYYLWKLFKTGRGKFKIYAGISLGLALGSKFSAVLLVPIILFLLLVYARKDKDIRTSRIKRFLNYSIWMGALAFIVVYILYFFPSNLGFYLKGMNSIYADAAKGYQYYLNGSFFQNGKWYYFLEAFLIKTPIPALFAFLLAFIFYRKYKLSGLEKLFIFTPIIIFLLVTTFKAHDIGVRYILPIYPFLILFTGGLAELNFGLNKKAVFAVAAGLGVWYASSAIKIYPDYLAYFNELVGGPANGYRYLDDSNLDWGQDLKRLKAYQILHPETKVIYAWRKSSPEYYGIQNDLFATGMSKQPPQNPSGRYAVDINFLIRMRAEAAGTKDKYVDWLDLYKPVDKIGYSFLIYKF